MCTEISLSNHRLQMARLHVCLLVMANFKKDDKWKPKKTRNRGLTGADTVADSKHRSTRSKRRTVTIAMENSALSSFSLRNFKEDCLLISVANGGNVKFQCSIRTEDDLSPTLESDFVLDWLGSLRVTKLIEYT